MKKEDKKQPRHREHTEEKFTREQVISLAQLITAGVMGVGGEECVEDAQKLPPTLQAILISSIMAARECMKDMIPSMLSSLASKVAAAKK